MQCSGSHSTGVQGSPPGVRWKDHTFRQLLVLLADSLMFPLYILPSSSPAGSAVKFTLQSVLMQSEESHPRWLAAAPVSHF